MWIRFLCVSYTRRHKPCQSWYLVPPETYPHYGMHTGNGKRTNIKLRMCFFIGFPPPAPKFLAPLLTNIFNINMCYPFRVGYIVSWEIEIKRKTLILSSLGDCLYRRSRWWEEIGFPIKKHSKQLIKNYWPRSLLPICGKILENIIFKRLYNTLTSSSYQQKSNWFS